jgi:hypothetical protein
VRASTILCFGLIASGCIWPPKNESAKASPERDLELYHIRLIRPGMSIDDADRIASFRDRPQATDTSTAKAITGDCGIIVELADGKVEESRTDIRVTCVDTPPTEDTSFLNRLRFGMTPTEVAKEIGAPKYGYENTPGTVVLLYESRPAIELTFVEQKLEKWRRTHTYSAGKNDLLPGLTR